MSAQNKSYPLGYEINGTLLYINQSVLNIFLEHRQLTLSDNESFGVLIGSKSLNEENYWIDEVTTPFPEDKASRCRYTMQDPQHQEAVEKSFQKSSGERIYMGTWHTHPESHPNPSLIDKNDWRKCHKRNPDRKLFFIISGIKEIKVFFKSGTAFLAMKPVGT